MKIVITDSGLGGLSVAAALYERLILDRFGGVEIIFANALPESGKGYNKMPDTATKVKVFDNALKGFHKHFQPDMISVACNTLSVLLEFSEFANKHSRIISDVVSTGVHGFLESNQVANADNIIIFGTETTIDSGIHAEQFSKVFQDRIYAIACSGLAGAIEKDFQSKETYDLINQAVNQINVKSSMTKNYAYLACTHYGYVKDIFYKILIDKGIENVKMVDPNVNLVDDLYTQITSKNISKNSFSSKISVVSRCRILDSEIQSISKLVQSVSQETAKTLQNYEISENLF